MTKLNFFSYNPNRSNPNNIYTKRITKDKALNYLINDSNSKHSQTFYTYFKNFLTSNYTTPNTSSINIYIDNIHHTLYLKPNDQTYYIKIESYHTTITDYISYLITKDIQNLTSNNDTIKQLLYYDLQNHISTIQGI